jgi:uncharacterized protein involved in exopolysaccharide biosynthesis
MDEELIHVQAVTVRPGQIRRAVEAVFRHSKLAYGSFIAIAAGALLGAALMPQSFQAEMKFLVTNERTEPVVSADENTGAPADRENVNEEKLNSEVELIKSDDVIRQVLTTMGHPRPSSISEWLHRDEFSSGWQTRNFRSHLQIEVIKKSNVIAVRYTCGDAQFAAKALRVLATAYEDKHLQVHRPAGEYEFFARQADQYQKELAAAEAKLASARTVSPQAARDLTLQKLNDFKTGLEQTRTAIREAVLRIRTLEQQGTATPQRMTTQLRSADNPQLLEQLKSTLLNLQLKRDELLTKYQPTYRVVQDLEHQIADTRAAIEREESHPIREETTDQNPTAGWINAELAKSKTDLEGLRARATALESVIANYSLELKNLDRSSLEHDDIARAAKVAEDNYLLYSRKREQARISEALDRNRFLNVAIVQDAEMPMQPEHSRMRYFAVGLFLALLLSGGVVYFVDRMDPSFHTPEDLARGLGLPVLAFVPKSRSHPPLISGEDQKLIIPQA